MHTASLESRDHILIGYGEVMSIVQRWEQALALVWWRVGRKHKNRPTGDFDTPRSQREIMRLEAAFLRTPAQQVRETVAPHLEERTAADLNDLMAARNMLAHRFLRDQALGDGFTPGSHAGLIELGNRFRESLDSIVCTIDSFETYQGPVPEHWPALAERIADRVFRGETIPRDPSQQ